MLAVITLAKIIITISYDAKTSNALTTLKNQVSNS